MSALDERLRALAGRRRRVTLDELWRAFRDVEPVLAASTRQRHELWTAVLRLENAGVITLPRTAAGWDTSADPKIPRWIQLAPPPEVTADDVVEVAWAPELEFGRGVVRSDHRSILLAVQRFLAAGGRDRPAVPARERSVELFGDEKAIDALSRTALFGSGRLSYALLRAFPVSPPMFTNEVDGAPPLALVVENHHTFHSFSRWNREVRAYSVVGYGAGKAAWSSISSLRDVADRRRIECIEYFGDLDREGVRIAARLAIEARRSRLPDVVAARRWYALLLERGERVAAIRDDATPVESSDLDWFPPELRAGVAVIVERGTRLPQELVGWEVLCGQGAEPESRPGPHPGRAQGR